MEISFIFIILIVFRNVKIHTNLNIMIVEINLRRENGFLNCLREFIEYYNLTQRKIEILLANNENNFF